MVGSRGGGSDETTVRTGPSPGPSPRTGTPGVRDDRARAGRGEGARGRRRRRGVMTSIRMELLGGFDVTVSGELVPARAWTRKQAATLVKLLALRPERRLHREQVLDLVWPDDPMDTAAAKLHKAAHYARKVTGHPGTIVLGGDVVQLFPDIDVSVDAIEFEQAAAEAIADADTERAAEVARLYRGDLLPDDIYEDWAAAPRERLRQLYVGVLTLLERWQDVVTVDPGDERAHLELMRQFVAAGDRYSALRQYDRLDRTLRTELGVQPGRDAVQLRDRLLHQEATQLPEEESLVGRAGELVALERMLDGTARRGARTVILSGEPGIGKTALLRRMTDEAAARGLAGRCRCRRVGRGSVGVRAAARRGRRPLPSPTSAARRAGRSLPAGDRPGPGGGRGAVVRQEHPSTPLRGRGRAPAAGRGDHGCGAGHRRRPGCGRGDAAPAPLPAARPRRGERGAAARPSHRPAHAGHARPAPHEPARPPRRDRARAGAARRRGHRRAGGTPRRPTRPPSSASASPCSPAATRTWRSSWPSGAGGPSWAADLDVLAVAGIPPATRELLQRVAVAGSTFDIDEFVALSGLPDEEAFAQLDHADRPADPRAGRRRLPLPASVGPGRAAGGSAAPPPAAHPPRYR